MELWYFNSNDKWSQVAAQVAGLLQCSEQQVKKNLLSLANYNNDEPHFCLSLIQQLAARLHESEKLSSVLSNENKQLATMLVKQNQQFSTQSTSTSMPVKDASYDLFTRRNILQHNVAAVEEEESPNCSPLSTATTATAESYFSQAEDVNSCDFSESDNSSAVEEQQDDMYSCNTEYNTCTCDELIENSSEQLEDSQVETETTLMEETEEAEEQPAIATAIVNTITAITTNATIIGDDSDNEDATSDDEQQGYKANNKYEIYEDAILSTSSGMRNKGKKNKIVRFDEVDVPTMAGSSSSKDELLMRKRKQKQQSKLLRSAVKR